MMSVDELREAVKVDRLLTPYISRDQSRVESMREQLRQLFAQGKTIDAWFMLRRWGVAGMIPSEVSEAFHEVATSDPRSAWEILADVSDPLALGLLALPLTDSRHREAAIDAAQRLSDKRLFGFVVLRLVELAANSVSALGRNTGIDEETLRKEISSSLAPVRTLIQKVEWDAQLRTWEGIVDHIPAITFGGPTVVWESVICNILADRFANEQSARGLLAWPKSMTEEVAIAALPYAAARVIGDEKYQDHLFDAFLFHIEQRLEKEPQHLWNEGITSHAVLWESLGWAITISTSTEGNPPDWYLRWLNSFNTPMEGWKVDSIRVREDISRTAWLLSAGLIALPMFAQDDRPFSPVARAIVNAALQRLEGWLWEFEPAPDTVRRFCLELVRAMPLLGRESQSILLSVAQLIDLPTLEHVIKAVEDLLDPSDREAFLSVALPRRARANLEMTYEPVRQS